jgi:hypothetical protein
MSASLATALQRTHLDASSSNSNTNTNASMSKLSSSGLPVTPTGSSNAPPLPSPALSMGSIAGGSSGNRASNRHASLRFGESGIGSASQRNTNRYSVTALYSMAAEQDTEIEDELARGAYFRLQLNGHTSRMGVPQLSFSRGRFLNDGNTVQALQY